MCDREPCARCAIKHLAQARALMYEVPKGYPQHVWFAMGHMAEAEDEIVGIDIFSAEAIRDERKKIEDSLDDGEKGTPYIPNFGELMETVANRLMLPEFFVESEVSDDQS